MAQSSDPFLDKYDLYKNFQPKKATQYNDIDGSPYLKDNFTVGEVIYKNNQTLSIPLRYNIFSDQFEYQNNDINYCIGNPSEIKEIILDNNIYEYLNYNQKGGYFQLAYSGKYSLYIKKSIKYNPEEGPKPIVGVATPARFTKQPDVYLMKKGENIYIVKTIKAVTTTLKKDNIDITDFLKAERIRSANKNNLLKIFEHIESL